jgi:hypothetical protein
VSLNDTVCVPRYVPAAGENVGVATVPALMVYVAEPTLLSKNPLAIAIAFNVSVALTATGPLYNAELTVGVDPSVV